MIKQIQKELTYNDISLFSREISDIKSRFSDEINLKQSIQFGLMKNNKVDIGLLFSAPMFDISGLDMCKHLDKNNQQAILHRFNQIDEMISDIRLLLKSNQNKLISFSIGLNDYNERLDAFTKMIVEDKILDYNFLICIDTANGANTMLKPVIDKITYIKQNILHRNINIEIMAGNVTCKEHVEWLVGLGVKFVRVGVSTGSACSTSEVAGIYRPSASMLLEMANDRLPNEDYYLVADGGIKNSSDILKAIACGADFVMMGGFFAGNYYSNSPIFVQYQSSERLSVLNESLYSTQILNTNNTNYKYTYGNDYVTNEFISKDKLDLYQNKKIKAYYRGMASESMALLNNKVNNLNKNILPEGVEYTVDFKPKYKSEEDLERLINGLKSGFSYTNAKTIKEFKSNIEIIEITTNGLEQRKPHLK
jgi:IMP dehydrogenase/GMP reductase